MPFYRAPEIARGLSGNTPFTDVYSFAILAYQTLRGDHPLIGDLVEESSLYAEDAERGLVPWTGHSTDDRNRSRYGIQADWVLTGRLERLFRKNFEDGSNDPFQRPTAGTWAEALSATADLTVNCRKTTCRHSYLVRRPSCPFCQTARPDTLLVGVRDQVPADLGTRRTEPALLDPHDWIVLQQDQALTVTARHTRLVPDDPNVEVLRMRWPGGGSVQVDNIGDDVVRLVPPKGDAGRSLPPGASVSERVIDADWRLHFGDDRRIHRVLTFRRPA